VSDENPARAMGRLRWVGSTAAERREHALMMLRARRAKRAKRLHKRAKRAVADKRG
jgi:hypothetical protein